MSHATRGELTLETALRMLLFAVVLALFVIPIIAKLYDLLAGSARPGTINSMNLLAKEIKYLEGETLVPLYVDPKYKIVGFDVSDTSKPERCDKDLSCLCTCEVEGCTYSTIQQCIDLEYEAGDKKLRLNGLVVGPTEKVTNFLVILAGDTISLSPMPGASAR